MEISPYRTYPMFPVQIYRTRNYWVAHIADTIHLKLSYIFDASIQTPQLLSILVIKFKQVQFTT